MAKRSPQNSVRILIVFSAILPLLLWSLSSSAFHLPGARNESANPATASGPTHLVRDRAPASFGYIVPSLPAPVPAPTVGPGVAPDGDPGGFGIDGDLRSNFPGPLQAAPPSETTCSTTMARPEQFFRPMGTETLLNTLLMGSAIPIKTSWAAATNSMTTQHFGVGASASLR